MADTASYFSDDPMEARDQFLDRCTRTGLTVRTLPARLDTDAGHYCDVARLGAPSAEYLLVLASGASSAASLVNAGICCALLGEQVQRHLNRNVAILLVHSPYPNGPTWLSSRPETEPVGTRKDSPPESRETGWSNELLNAADARFRAHMQQKKTVKAAPGEMPGGKQAAWSIEDAAKIAKTQLKSARFTLFLDFRTGLGAWADPNIVDTGLPGSAARQRLHRWFQAARSGPLYDPAAPPAAGRPNHLENAEHVSATVEFGTYRKASALGTMTSLDAVFDPYPKSRDWRTRIWKQAEMTIVQGIAACEEMAEAAHNPRAGQNRDRI